MKKDLCTLYTSLATPKKKYLLNWTSAEVYFREKECFSFLILHFFVQNAIRAIVGEHYKFMSIHDCLRPL